MTVNDQFKRSVTFAEQEIMELTDSEVSTKDINRDGAFTPPVLALTMKSPFSVDYC